MQKYLKILEKNVHWIALGLGGIYLMWMVYSYIISTPVSVKVGARELGPESVDQAIYEDKGKRLEQAINHPGKITVPTFDVLTPYLAALEEKDAKTPEIALSWGGTRSEVINEEGSGGLGPNNRGAKIASLPKLPKAIYVNDSHGITVVMPGMTSQPAGGAVQQVNMIGKDTRWESLRFKIPTAALATSFTDAYKAAELQQLFVTSVLQVQLFRQEKLPNDQWSEAAQVKIEVEGLPPYPGDKVSPKSVNDRKAGFEFKTAAAKMAKDILTPAFPTIIPGSPAWYAPGAPEPLRARPLGAPGAAAAPAAPASPAAAIPRIPVMPFNSAPANAPGVNPVGTAQVGEGQFDVTTLVDDKEIVVHDLTVQDGKTYRYAIQYKLNNPVWDTTTIAKGDLVEVFALVSDMSDWTPEVKVKRHTRVFVTAITNAKVTFAVFDWRAGHTIRTPAEAVPGDTIKDTTVVDIRPDPAHRGETVVLLLEDGNQLKAHSKRGDAENPEFDELKNDALVEVPGPVR